MTTITEAYLRIRDTYQNFSATPDSRPARKEFFQALHALQPAECLDDDTYFERANLVLQKKTLQNSFHLLERPAKNYCDRVADITSLVENSPLPPENLAQKLHELAVAHIHFINAYVPLYLQTYRDTPPVVSHQNPKGVQVICDALSPDLAKFQEQIDERAGELNIRIPSLMVEKLVASFDRDKMPEFFHAELIDELFKKSFSYQNLSPEEQRNLHLKLIGEEVDLQPCTQELYKSIGKLAAAIKGNKYNAVLGAAMHTLATK